MSKIREPFLSGREGGREVPYHSLRSRFSGEGRRSSGAPAYRTVRARLVTARARLATARARLAAARARLDRVAYYKLGF